MFIRCKRRFLKMGKTKGNTKSFRSGPLEQQLLADNSVKPITRQKKRKRDEAGDNVRRNTVISLNNFSERSSGYLAP